MEPNRSRQVEKLEIRMNGTTKKESSGPDLSASRICFDVYWPLSRSFPRVVVQCALIEVLYIPPVSISFLIVLESPSMEDACLSWVMCPITEQDFGFGFISLKGLFRRLNSPTENCLVFAASTQGCKSPWLQGSQADHVQPLSTDKTQRQRREWWSNKKGTYFREANTGKT